MPAQALVALLWGTLLAQSPVSPPQTPVATVAPARVAESDATRIQSLGRLVVAAEQALEAEDEETATLRSDEADVLTADWSPDLLARPEVQDLLQRLKEVQEQLADEGAPDLEPGLKAQEEIVTISGDELRAELELVRAAEHGATYDFPIDLNDKVLTWVSLFSSTKRGFMENALGRASMYMPMIRQVFAEEGVPSDLAYLAVIESGFRNEAKSRAKAVGMWQFIRSTGRIYGLNGTAWVEERRDPVKATRAAARYLKRLYEITGDWYLASSSYNAGPLTLERAILNVGSRNYWDLARSRWLRTETKNYVPELCAAILVGRNPERYGLRILPLVPLAYETVTVARMTSLAVLARCASTDASTLKALNPELLRGSTPPGSYQLRVPPGKAMDCLRLLARMPSGQRLDFQGYTVRKGDTLAKVAKRFKVSPEDLLESNDLTAKQFKPGRRLLVPPAPLQAVEERDIASSPKGIRALGDRPLRPLPAMPSDLGGLAETTPKPQGADRVPPAAPVAKGAAQATSHLVRKGDTLSSIARTYGLAPQNLRAWNRIKGDHIQPGQQLRLAPR